MDVRDTRLYDRQRMNQVSDFSCDRGKYARKTSRINANGATLKATVMLVLSDTGYRSSAHGIFTGTPASISYQILGDTQYLAWLAGSSDASSGLCSSKRWTPVNILFDLIRTCLRNWSCKLHRMSLCYCT